MKPPENAIGKPEWRRLNPFEAGEAIGGRESFA
jgi:hypothetical protein